MKIVILLTVVIGGLFLTYAAVTTFYVFEDPGSQAFGADCTDEPERYYHYRNTITGKEIKLLGNGCRTEPRGYFWQALD